MESQELIQQSGNSHEFGSQMAKEKGNYTLEQKLRENQKINSDPRNKFVKARDEMFKLSNHKTHFNIHKSNFKRD